MCVSCELSFLKYTLLFVCSFICFLKREKEGIALGGWGGGQDLVGAGKGKYNFNILSENILNKNFYLHT